MKAFFKNNFFSKTSGDKASPKTVLNQVEEHAHFLYTVAQYLLEKPVI